MWLTVPVAPSGLLPNATAVVDTMLVAGVDLDGINVMTMNYGSSRPQRPGNRPGEPSRRNEPSPWRPLR